MNSESEDEPRNSSDEDWKPDKQPKKKNYILRKSVRVNKKAKTYTSSEDDAVPGQGNAAVGRNGVKKRKPHGRRAPSEGSRNPTQAITTFKSGAFVVAKNDAESYVVGAPPHIWRIDGKALLQKFEPVPEQTELRYKNTSVYSGWSEMETGNYTIIKNISFIYNTPQRVEITFNTNEFKNMPVKSD